MVEPKQEKWHEIVKRVEDVGLMVLSLTLVVHMGWQNEAWVLPLVKSLNWWKTNVLGKGSGAYTCYC